MPSEYDNIYTPQTVVTQAGLKALSVHQNQLQKDIEAWDRERERRKAEINQSLVLVENEKGVSREEKAQNWSVEKTLEKEISNFEGEYSLMTLKETEISRREREYQAREVQRRRNRTVSMAFIEDNFAKRTVLDVVGHLRDSSARIREHAMRNISFCINGPCEVPPSFVRFGATDIAPYLLPALEQLLTQCMTVEGPLDFEKQFAEEVVSSPPMAKALALSGKCPQLADYLVRENEVISRLAISSLGQMIRSEPAVAKNAYIALNTVVSRLPIPDTQSDSVHPSIIFFEEVSPRIVGDCLNNNLWTEVAPLVQLRIDSIRRVVLPKIASEARNSDRVRLGLVEAGTMHLLDSYYELRQPPPDTIEFFTALVPLLAPKMCHRYQEVRWLVKRLADPNAKINVAVIEALRASSRKDDPAVHKAFVKANILQKLNNPPTRASPGLTKLICNLLPVLAIPHARSETCSRMIGFLDHTEVTVANSCLMACKKILDSSVENRAHLYSEFSRLKFTKESTLKLCDYAIPILCKDWASSGDFAKISSHVFHQEQRVRVAAHPVWRTILSNSPDARANIPLDEIFKLCDSPHEDCLILGYQVLPLMATEIAKIGATSTSRLVKLLNDPRLEMRQAVLRSIQIISESSDTNCELLREAGTFHALKLSLQENPRDGVENAHTILVRLAPFLSRSRQECYELVQLLESKVPQVENAARAALASISYRNINYRESLRDAILESLELASDTLLDFSAQSIQEWIGPDLAQLNNFEKLFQLVSHHDKRIQHGALISLTQIVQNERYHESLERTGVVATILSLSTTDNAQAIGFTDFALRSLALTLARTGHVGDILLLLNSEIPKIREGASAAIQDISSATESDREYLLREDIVERLTGGDEGQGQSQTALQLAGTIIPKLSPTYNRADRIQSILTLVDHKQQQIRATAATSVTAIATGTDTERRLLRNTLLPLLGSASAALRETASKCLEQALARDLISDGNWTQIFGLLENEDPQIRAPVIFELQRHIRTSSETDRRVLVDAGILNAVLKASSDATVDLLMFTADCILRVLGPSFTQSDGGAAIIPLLTDPDSRIRSAAALAIRNGVDSRHGNLLNMANAGIISHVYSAVDDDVIRDLWCYMLPKISPFLSNRHEIDVLFESLSDGHPLVREAASEAIGVMAKTSDETRLHLFPALLPRLDGPLAGSQRHIAQAVALSGFAFAFNNKETDLLRLIRNGEPSLLEAAVTAVTHLLVAGSASEHRKLMEADVFIIAMELHESGGKRKLSLKLLDDIIRYLTDAIILDEELAEQLLYLFDDPHTPLWRTLLQSLMKVVDDSRVFEISTLPQLLPILLDADRHRKQPVSRLLCHSAPSMVPRLLKLRRVDIIIKLLVDQQEATITKAYLEAINISLKNSATQERGTLSDEPQFVSALGDFLKTRDVILRRISSEIITTITEYSPLGSSMLVEEGVCGSLAEISIRGGIDARASLNALSALFSTASDHTDQHFKGILPALCNILEADHHSAEVYISALRFLKRFSQKAPSRVITGSSIIDCLVSWSNPQHSSPDAGCRQIVLEVCQQVAQNSDAGRKALIDGRILPILLRLAADKIASNVIGSCGVLKALAHSGTCQAAMLSAGVKDAMEKITSPFSKSTLEKKEDKKLAQDAAKEVLVMLKSTSPPVSPSTNTFFRSLGLGRRTSMNQISPASPINTSGIGRGAPEGVSPGHLSRSFSESAAHPHRGIAEQYRPHRVPTDPGRVTLGALAEDDDVEH